jgi:hypothetical protein
MMKPICSLRHCECDGHTVHRLSQRRLTTDWLDLWESDYPRLQSKVSSDGLPSYIKATQKVLEIFKTAGYFTDNPEVVFQFRYINSAAAKFIIPCPNLYCNKFRHIQGTKDNIGEVTCFRSANQQNCAVPAKMKLRCTDTSDEPVAFSEDRDTQVLLKRRYRLSNYEIVHRTR